MVPAYKVREKEGKNFSGTAKKPLNPGANITSG
jgi:hypothetical protein